MIDLGLKSLVVGLSLFAIVVAGGCAKGSQTSGGGGTAGEGASGEGAAPAGGTGGSGAASTGGGGTTTSDTTSTSDTSMTTTTTSGSGTCASGQHECSGQCFGNTPESGCLQAEAGCPPCSQPANGAASCTVAGACDFSCGTGYSKQGGACVCDTACCKDADCTAGQTCQGGTCSGGGAGGGGACDDNTCQFSCIAQCIMNGQIGLGSCVGGVCDCQCL